MPISSWVSNLLRAFASAGAVQALHEPRVSAAGPGTAPVDMLVAWTFLDRYGALPLARRLARRVLRPALSEPQMCP